MTKYYMIKTVLLVGIITCVLHISCTHESPYSLELINTSENIWGYLILSGEKTIIYQEYIPCIKGNIPFASKSDAKKIGLLVLDKLQNNQRPSCTLEELKEYNIITKKF